MICSEATVALQAFDQRVGEGRHVTGCLPHLGGQDYRAVETDHVGAAAHKRLPPLAFDVLFELDTEGTVVPCGPRAAIDFTGLEHESAPFGKGDDGVERVWRGHEVTPVFQPSWMPGRG